AFGMCSFYFLLIPGGVGERVLLRKGFSRDVVAAATKQSGALSNHAKWAWVVLLTVMLWCQGISTATAPFWMQTAERVLARDAGETAGRRASAGGGVMKQARTLATHV